MSTSEALKKQMQKPLVVGGELPSDMEAEILDIVTGAVDKFISTENYELSHTSPAQRLSLMRLFMLQKAAQTAKEALDRKFGASWHCVIGEGFGYQVTYQARNTLFCYYAEKLGILVWKA